VHPHTLTEGWDVFIFGIPLIALLFFGYFRLDETFTTRKRTPVPTPGPIPTIERDGKSMGTDPDGRAWESRPSRRRRETV
jgi:hypothetical protein